MGIRSEFVQNCEIKYTSVLKVLPPPCSRVTHYSDVTIGAMACQITSLTIVYSTVYSSADQRKYQSSASLAFMWGIHRWPVNSPHKWPVTRKMYPFDDVMMWITLFYTTYTIYPLSYWTDFRKRENVFVHLFRNIGMVQVFTIRPRQHKDPFITNNQYFGCQHRPVICSHCTGRVLSQNFSLSTKRFSANVLMQNREHHATLHIHL